MHWILTIIPLTTCGGRGLLTGRQESPQNQLWWDRKFLQLSAGEGPERRRGKEAWRPACLWFHSRRESRPASH